MNGLIDCLADISAAFGEDAQLQIGTEGRGAIVTLTREFRFASLSELSQLITDVQGKTKGKIQLGLNSNNTRMLVRLLLGQDRSDTLGPKGQDEVNAHRLQRDLNKLFLELDLEREEAKNYALDQMDGDTDVLTRTRQKVIFIYPQTSVDYKLVEIIKQADDIVSTWEALAEAGKMGAGKQKLAAISLFKRIQAMIEPMKNR